MANNFGCTIYPFMPIFYSLRVGHRRDRGRRCWGGGRGSGEGEGGRARRGRGELRRVLFGEYNSLMRAIGEMMWLNGQAIANPQSQGPWAGSAIGRNQTILCISPPDCRYQSGPAPRLRPLPEPPPAQGRTAAPRPPSPARPLAASPSPDPARPRKTPKGPRPIRSQTHLKESRSQAQPSSQTSPPQKSTPRDCSARSPAPAAQAIKN